MNELAMYQEIAESGCNEAINSCLEGFETFKHISPLTNEDKKIVSILKSGLQ